MDIHRQMAKDGMHIHGYLWIFIDIHGYSWLSHGYPWISMDIV
jgi:hypothetical protein